MITTAPAIKRIATNEILSLTIPWHEESLLHFLARFDHLPSMYIEQENANVSIAGAGIVARIEAHGENRFAEIRAKSAELFSRIKNIPTVEAYVIPKLIGGFSFSSSSSPEKHWSGFPAAAFVLPAYMLSKVDGSYWLTLNRELPAEADQDFYAANLQEELVELRTAQSGWDENTRPPRANKEINYLLSQENWEAMISKAVGKIKGGALDKVVLARICSLKTELHFDLIRSLKRLASTYPGCSRFCLEFNQGHAFFGATPERLIMVKEGVFETTALAGSIRRGSTPAEDRQLSEELLNNPKERHEHRLVVDDLRTRLQPLTSELIIGEPPSISILSNIQHLQTKLRGNLKNGSSILDMVESLHPTAALGGYPRREALQLIDELETQSRGWYGGPIGWFDADGDGEFVVAIRSGIVSGKEAWLYSGAGIVADSQPTSEWYETQLKLKPMLVALGGE